MLAYYFRIALKSLRRNPMLTALMIGAIAVGVGVCITTLTVYRLMSGNPIEHRNDVLYRSRSTAGIRIRRGATITRSCRRPS